MSSHAEALEVDHRIVTYSELIKKVRVYRAHFENDLKGISRVGVMLPNSMELIISLLALSLLNKQFFLLSPKLTEVQVTQLVKSNGIEKLIDEGYNLEVNETKDQPINRRIQLGSVHILTSGTTGIHKSIGRRFKPLGFVRVFVDLVDKLSLEEVAKCYIGVPVYHGYGLATMMTGFALGKKIVTSDGDVVRELQKQSGDQSFLIALVPTQLCKLLDAKYLFNNNEKVIVGGAPLSQKILDDFRKTKPNCSFYNLYGTSESGVSFLSQISLDSKVSVNIGKPLKGVDWKLENEELILNTPWSYKEGWIHTGDCVERMENGNFKWMGRVDDMIISGGINAFPIELEDVARCSAHVVDVKAEAVSDEKFHQRFRLKVQAPADFQLAAFQQTLSQRLPPHLIPKEIVLVSKIDRNEMGK
ncbi:AMP-binding protein [Parvicella tangerina]|nr:AMP-binding protein [Parvicella tangerina]